MTIKIPSSVIALLFGVTLTACGSSSADEQGGAGGADSVSTSVTGSGNSDINGSVNTTDTNNSGVAGNNGAQTSSDSLLASDAAKIRFLMQATFGATPADIRNDDLTSAADWLVAQFNLTPTYHLPVFERYMQQYPPVPDDEVGEEDELILSQQVLSSPASVFWVNAISAPDQLRQRMVYALSQLLVVSNFGGEELADNPNAMVYFQDQLTEHAFGNYRELLEAVTYSPAMGHYLTYLGNEKGDPVTGRMPDENYAREILQLFTVGLVQLNKNGTPVLNASGQPLELYTNKDITGLARVFTGLSFDEALFEEEEEQQLNLVWSAPMIMMAQEHSPREKSFLGLTIPANTGGRQSISMALDHIFNHPNVAPFISRQLIQRFVTSHPSPAYIERVATAFENGTYVLPNSVSIGDNRRGDLKATLAAILMDKEARRQSYSISFGKVREPVIRITNWARAFNIREVRPEFWEQFSESISPEVLNQQAYGSPSVFNFYRPGYVAAGTLTGKAGMTMPELQITNASSITGYANFLNTLVSDELRYLDTEVIIEWLEESELDLDAISMADVRSSFSPDYSREYQLAANPAALIRRLDLLLAYGSLTDETRQRIMAAISEIPLDEIEEGRDGAMQRVQQAVLMVMTSPEYLVQQ
ncbi:MAG: DUF1800 domain-containing protein [Thiolinea sp.]